MTMLLCIIFAMTAVYISGYTECEIKDRSVSAISHFYGRPNTSMENEMISIPNISKKTCMQKCRTNVSCLAFTYAPYLQSCNLFEYDSKTGEMAITAAPGVWFYDMRDDSLNKQNYFGRCAQGQRCINGGSCLNDCSTRGYHCACTELYHGEFCQNIFKHTPVLVQTIAREGTISSVGFTHKGTHYLAISGVSGVATKMYKYNGDQYEYFSTLPGINVVYKMEAFEINGKMFLMVPNYTNGGAYITTSNLFILNDDTGEFDQYQSFNTEGALSASYLKAGDGNGYLLIGSHYGSSYDVNSVVYRWDDVQQLFVQLAVLPTHGAYFCKLFEIDNTVYAGIPNYNSATHLHAELSSIWRMDPADSTSWSVVQSLPETVSGSVSINVFETGSDTFLLHVDHLYCEATTILFKWDKQAEQFEIHQRIPLVHCPVDSEIFKAGGEVFMVTSNIKSLWSGGTYSVLSQFFKLEGSVFVKYLTLQGREIWDWNSYERDGELFLARSTLRNETTDDMQDTRFKIYQWT